MVKVSIIIPVYGVEKYIERCLNSVVNQTLKEIEIIIVNDATKDNSMEICHKFKESDDRIKIFNKENEGLGLTRNYGLNHASGKYVAFLDSDDYIDLDFYEKLYEKAELEESDICFTRIKRVKGNYVSLANESIFSENKMYTPKDILNNILYVDNNINNYTYMEMCVWRSIYKNSIIKENNILFVSEREFISEDIFFNIDFLMKAKRASLISNTYYYYCYNDNSLTKTFKEDRFEKNKKLYYGIIAYLEKHDIYDEKTEIGVCRLLLGYIRGLIKDESNNNVYKFTEKLKRIKNIVNDELVIKIINNRKRNNFKRNIFDYFIKIKSSVILFMLSKF